MKITLSTRAAIRLAEALQALDRTSPDGANVYKLAGTVRMALAKNMAELDKVMRAYQKARNQLVYDHGNGSNQVAPDRIAEFERAHGEMLEERHSLELIRITEALLQLEANEINVGTLAALLPMLREDDSMEPAEAA